MSLTKKDFIKVAEILNKGTQTIQIKGVLSTIKKEQDLNFYYVLNSFIKWFKEENTNFDEVKFKEACLK